MEIFVVEEVEEVEEVSIIVVVVVAVVDKACDDTMSEMELVVWVWGSPTPFPFTCFIPGLERSEQMVNSLKRVK